MSEKHAPTSPTFLPVLIFFFHMKAVADGITVSFKKLTWTRNDLFVTMTDAFASDTSVWTTPCDMPRGAGKT